MKAKQQPRVICGSTFVTLVMIAVLGCSQEVLAQQWTTNGNDISNTNSGNVGVGTATPDVNAKLHVFKPLGAGVDIQSPNTGGWSRVRLVTGTRTYGWFAGDAGNSDAPNKIGLYDYNALAFRMMIDSSGKVGIGTSSPSSALQLNSAAASFSSIGQFLITDSADTNRNLRFGYDASVEAGWIQASKIGTSYQPLLLNPNDGNVGIGTTTPVSPLDVQLSSATANKLLGRFGNNSASGGGALRVYANVASNGTLYPALELTDASYWIGSLAADRSTGLRFRTGSNISSGESNLADRMVISPAGNVGIGTTTPSPSKKLHVVGDVEVTGNIAAKYQDVAEWVPAARALAPGTVVTLNPTQSNLVEASSKAYDTRVAGVISTQPGITLGERGENKVLVATTGRVRIKVDATYAPINIGDLLVTSDTPGMAMKSKPITIGRRKIHSPGTLIGKALEPLGNGHGEILVLLSLQ